MNTSNKNPPWWKGTQGEWWVVGQVFLGILSILPLPGPYWSIPFNHPWLIMGGLVASVGTMLIVWSFMSLGKNLRAQPRPMEGNTLVHHGPYAAIKHPIYTAVTLVDLGFQIARASWLGLVWPPLLLCYLYKKALREEQWLMKMHPGYEDYMARSRRFFPWPPKR